VNELFTIAYSPWSEKARWALDHHRVQYKERKFVPMLSQPGLRLRLRQFRGRLTVPIFLDGKQVLSDSFEIAKHADHIGGGPTLFPIEKLDDIARWNDHSEAVMSAGRASVMARVRNDPEAQREYVASSIPSALAGALRPLARVGNAYLAHKYYAGEPGNEDELREATRALLSELLQALDGRAHLLERFSYADIAAAASLQQIAPVHDRFIPLSPAVRRSSTDPALAEEFSSLVAWRDRLYEQHR
jgi:glutathione S-transferase